MAEPGYKCPTRKFSEENSFQESYAIKQSTLKERVKSSLRKHAQEEFARDTTIHSIKQFLSPNQPCCGRIVWIFLFLCSLGLCFQTIVPQFIAHNEGQTTLMYQTVQANKLVFPAITLCNNNMLRKSIVGSTPAFYQSIMTQLGYTPDRADRMCANSTAPQVFNNLFSNLSYRHEFGIFLFAFGALDSLQSVVACKFQGRQLPCDQLFINKMTDAGLCFTFNPREEYRVKNLNDYTKEKYTYPPLIGPIFEVDTSGPGLGLELVLNTQQFEYCDTGGTDRAGFRMMIHSPDVEPMFTTEPSINLSPGTDTEISVRYWEERRETERIGRCSSSVNLEFQPDGGKYVKGSCHLEQLIKYIHSNCSCMPVFSPPKALQVMLQKENPPRTEAELICFGPKQTQCSFHSLENFKLQGHTKYATCKPACNTITYQEKISIQSFPSQNTLQFYMDKKYPRVSESMLVLMEKYNMTPLYLLANDKHGNFSSERELRDNLLSVRAYIESLTYDVQIEIEQLTHFALISNVGGAVGLFLGASMLSIFEVFHCVINVIASILRQDSVKS